jgi:carboxymethylenebutenolidase
MGRLNTKQGVPPPLLKWSEQGFAVVKILETAFDAADTSDGVFEMVVSELKDCPEYHKNGGNGLVGTQNQVCFVIFC